MGTSLVEAAVLVAIVTGPDPGVLLTKRTATLRRHAGQVSFPGGRIDPGDTSPEAAALRETWEEIGLPPDAVELCGRLSPLVTGTGYRVTPVLGLIGAGYVTRLCPAEVAAVFELKLSVLLDPRAPARGGALLQGNWHEYWTWPHDEHEIWGATASMLMELAARLRAAPDRHTATSQIPNL